MLYNLNVLQTAKASLPAGWPNCLLGVWTPSAIARTTSVSPCRDTSDTRTEALCRTPVACACSTSACASTLCRTTRTWTSLQYNTTHVIPMQGNIKCPPPPLSPRLSGQGIVCRREGPGIGSPRSANGSYLKGYQVAHSRLQLTREFLALDAAMS